MVSNTSPKRVLQLGWAKWVNRHRETLEAYLFLVPGFVVLLAFYLGPMFYNLYISLHDWGIRPGAFIGAENYIRILTDAKFWGSVKVTIFYVVMVVPAEIILGMVFAVLLFQNIKGKAFFRLFYFMPYVTSMVAIGIVWGWIFNANFGIMNAALQSLGLPPLRWLLEPNGVLKGIWQGLSLKVPLWMNGPSLALVTIAIVTVWHFLGFHIMSYLAGLTDIPREVVEAAVLDGASGWQLFRYVIVPLLSPITYVLSIIATIGAFQAFVLIYTMTGMGYAASPTTGEPLGTTRVITLYIFDTFFRLFKTGYGAAMAMVLFVLILVLTLIQMRVAGGRVHYVGR